MAEFRLTKKSQQQPQEVGVNQPQLDQEQQAGLLSTLGGGAMSGLHTIGSLMSTPSRAIWGTINGIAGGEGGYGNMNPWDSTGGIEASHVLGNAGVIAKNDPTRWELIPKFQNGQINPGDLGRGIIDMLGDPTSYIGVGAVTKAGSKAAREGARVAGFANQLRAGHRAALTFGLPFSEASHAIGTGDNAAKIFEKSGIPKLTAKIVESAPVRHMRGVFDWTTGGKSHADVQKHMPEYFNSLQDAKQENAGVILRHASQLRQSGHISLDDEDNLRKAFEGLGGHDPHGHAEEFHRIMNKMLDVDEHLGTGAHRLDDKVMKTVDGVTGMYDARKYTPRRITAGASQSGSNLSTASALARKQSGDRKVDRIYKGAHGGTSQMNEMTREYTRGERNPLYDAMESLGPDATKEEMAKAVAPVVAEKWGHAFEDKMYHPNTLKKIDKYAEQIGKHEKLKLDLDAKQNQLASMSADDIAKAGIAKHTSNVERMRANLLDPEYMKALPEKAIGAHIKAKDKLRAIADDAAEFAKLPDKKQKYITKRLAKLESMTDDEIRNSAADTYKKRFERAILRPEDKVVESAIKSHPRTIDKIGKKAKVVADEKIPRLQILKEEALKKFDSRHEKFARKFVNMAQDPAIRKVGLFGNHVLADALEGWNAASRRHISARTVQKILATAKHYDGEDGVRLADWMNSKGYDSRARNVNIPEGMMDEFADGGDELSESGAKAAVQKEWGPAIQRVAEHAGVDPDEIANKMLDPEMLNSIEELTPKYGGPPSETAISKAFKSAMSWWKGGTLAFPASRTRDAMGGVVQNALHGWINPKYTVLETNRLLSGKNLKQDYSHIPFVKDWLEKTGSEPTPENQTEAVRQMVGVFLPSESNMLADVATGQHAASLDHVLHNVPGQTDQSFWDQAVVQPAKTLIGKGTPSAEGEVPSWFGHGESGDGVVGRIKKAVKQQARMRGVAGQEETLLAPVKASEQVSAASDQFNRVGPFLQMTANGFDPKEAARRIGTAQVDYDASKFTPAERWIKNYIAPFYCVPVDHEILTRDGWKTYDQLTIGEEVLGYSLEGESLHWTPLQAVNVFDFDGELNVYRQTRRKRSERDPSVLEFFFTDDHQWPTIIPPRMIHSDRATRENGGAKTKIQYAGLKRFCRGADLQTQHTIPHSGSCEDLDNENSILSTRLARILGWVVTDGYHRNRNKSKDGSGSGHTEMMVYQSPSKYLDEIIDLLGTNPRKPHPDTGVVCVPVAIEDVKELLKVYKTKSDLPSIVTRLSSEAAEAMWHAMFNAEGTDNGIQTPHFAQTAVYNKPVLDAFQILCTMTGRSANISSTGAYVKKSKRYHVHNCISREQYTGKIWCPTTAYGTWVMRHNGAMIITGNSFQSRMMQSTAGQLADLKSPTSQIIKALDRAKSSSDPSIPDYVMSQTGTSFGEDKHGNKRYLVGAGLMHDPAVSMLGLLAGGNLRPAAYDTLSMLGPHIGTPLQRTVGQSFFQRGEPISQLDPTIPRLMSNIGESTGLMAPDPHAVDRFKYPGYQHVDTALGVLPYSREINAMRTIADPRKDLITKGLDTLTGLKIQTISPEKQLATLKKRAEKLAEESGGYKYSRVIMPDDVKEALRSVNPALAAKQDKLEVMLKEIYSKKKKTEARQSEEYRLKKKKKE